jgi:hypothetical protein
MKLDGGWRKCQCVGRPKVLWGSLLICVTRIAWRDSRRFNRWFGLVAWCIKFGENVLALCELSQYSVQGSSAFFSCALTLNVKLALFSRNSVWICFRLQPRPESVGCRESYHYAWKLVNTYSGECLDVTWTHAIVIGGFSQGFGLLVMMWCEDGRKVVLREIGCTPMAHCNIVLVVKVRVR